MKSKNLKKALSIATAFSVTFTSLQLGLVNCGNVSSVEAAQVGLIDSFQMSEFTMNDSYCKNAFSKEAEYLLSFDTNRLLAGFRENAGLNTYGARRYDGWEGCLIGGHSVSYYLKI